MANARCRLSGGRIGPGGGVAAAAVGGRVEARELPDMVSEPKIIGHTDIIGKWRSVEDG